MYILAPVPIFPLCCPLVRVLYSSVKCCEQAGEPLFDGFCPKNCFSYDTEAFLKGPRRFPDFSLLSPKWIQQLKSFCFNWKTTHACWCNVHALNNAFAEECTGGEWEGVSWVFLYRARVSFWRTQQTCYSPSFCVILRGDCGAPALPPLLLLLLPLALSLPVSSPLSHPTLNQALCNSRVFISARNNWQHFWHILVCFFCLLMSVRKTIVDRKYMAGSVVSRSFILVCFLS